MAYFSKADLDNLHHLYRINLINSCTGYKSANLIGTKSADNFENLAVFSSVTHMGSHPPLLGVFFRPTTVARNTYENIKETGVYTINHINEEIIEDAHHTSAKYDKLISEFEKTDLKPEYLNAFTAPFVKGAPVKLAMKFVEEYEIKSNGVILVIGEIIDLHIKDDMLDKDGFINLTLGKVAAINGLDGYAIPQLKKRLDYQRPK
ncbi:flavin reductase family protein [Aureibaculum sp. A20]|uniref:Flavin reductase family protein n=1 Tax=Aureibaculum flavum TaxID=2795986 RepID=A0ABS0WN09_9FLAO|nr:flavin reductase family protein [Aureibaculum flavum]MBJ2173324.1 flavin reductase family protein [Aureibaculum flavum]